MVASASIIFSACSGLAACFASYELIGTVMKSNVSYRKNKRSGKYEDRMMIRMRDDSLCFRYFEPLVEEMATSYSKEESNRMFDHYLDLKGMNPPWNGKYFLATKKTEALLIGIIVSCFLSFILGILSIVLGAILGLMFFLISVSSVRSEGQAIKNKIVMRLPFVVDEMALIRLANGSFRDSILTVANENKDHPIGAIFERARQDLDFGLTSRETLEALSRRMQDSSFDEVTFAIIKADELGRPVADTLSELAAQMRIKRQQHGETLSGQAQVKIMYPGFVIMLACMLIIMAPFVIQMINDVDMSIFGF